MTPRLKPVAPPSLAEFHRTITSGSNRWYAVCLRITRNPALAEDAVQDGLVSAWSKRRQFKHGARLDTWIHRIVVNAALQLLRKQRPMLDEQHAESALAETQTPADIQHLRDLDSELGTALLQLSELERVCFVLKHLEQWRLKEIAVELDVSVSNVKQALFRALPKLRDSLAHWQSTNGEQYDQ